MGVRLSHIEEETRGVNRHLLKQVGKGDCLAGTLAHTNGLAVAHKLHKLHKNNVKLVSVKAEGVHSTFKTRHMAVMIRAPHVYNSVEAAFCEFVVVVGNISGEVGGVAVLADKNVVFKLKRLNLLVGFALRLEHFGKNFGVFVPKRAVLFICQTLVGKYLYNFVNASVGIKTAFTEPHVIIYAIGVKVAFKPFYVGGKGIVDKRLTAFFGICVHIFVAVHIGKFLCANLDVLAVIAVLREFHRVLAEIELKIAGFEGFSEFCYLVTCVVHIKFPGDIISAPGKHLRKTVADGAASGVAHVHGAGGVGGNKFHHDLFAVTAVALAVVVPF